MSKKIEPEATDPILQAYLNEMEYIKLRFKVIDNLLLRKPHTTGFEATDVESMVLQIRLILETIILSSLIISKDKFTIQQSIIEEWDPTQILKKVKRINPNFYPKPLKPDFNEKFPQFVNLTEGYLTESEFSRLYGECGKLLHKPPINKPNHNYTATYDFIRNNLKKIENLLNHHIIEFHTGLAYVIHMAQTSNGLGSSFGNLYIAKSQL